MNKTATRQLSDKVLDNEEQSIRDQADGKAIKRLNNEAPRQHTSTRQ